MSGVRSFALVALAAVSLVIAAPTAQAQQSKATQVSVPSVFPAGSVVIVNAERALYYITGEGQARRYRVAVGNPEQLWMGRTFVAAKVEDPRWVPVNGDEPIEGGDPMNPLGQRALYLDWSLLRIHGTPSRKSIGSAVSNGCVRMLNEDVLDLFERVHIGAPVYAIKAWADATRFESKNPTERIQVNPEAYAAAQERLQEEIAMRREWEQEERRYERAASIGNDGRRSGRSSYGSAFEGPGWVGSRAGYGWRW